MCIEHNPDRTYAHMMYHCKTFYCNNLKFLHYNTFEMSQLPHEEHIALQK